MEELVRYVKALVALNVLMLTESQPGIKLELRLKTAGLTNREIAQLLGKTEAAVAKTITRSR